MSTKPSPQNPDQAHVQKLPSYEAHDRTGGLAQDATLNRIFLLVLLAAILYVLWLPVFPTGDGPVHLYYADVLWSLVHHQPVYAHDYAIRHLLAPYLIHYLALISFEHFVPPTMAEKLFIALIFITQAFGFRFLARTLGREALGERIHTVHLPAGEAPLACLWMLLLLFSWSLGGGFLNCCFATGIALWAYGVWIRLGRRPAPKPALLLSFAALLITLVLSHPVPLMVLLLFTASDLLLRTVDHFLCRARNKQLASNKPDEQQTWIAQLAALTLTLGAFLAPAMIAQKGQAAAAVAGIGFHPDVLLQLVSGKGVGLFASTGLHSISGWIEICTRAGLGIIVPGVAILLRRAKRLSAAPTSPSIPHQAAAASAYISLFEALPTTAAGRLLLISLLYLACTLFFPLSLNHSYFFPQRMWNIVWLLILACAAAAKPSPQARRWLTLTALLLIALTAATSLPLFASIAVAQQQLAAAALPPGKRGLLLEPDSVEQTRGTGTTYPVYSWAGARAFAASHAILLNSPWLGLTILPIRDATAPGPHPLLDIGLPSIYSESPLALTHALAQPSPDRSAILARADFLLYSNPASLASPRAAQDTLQAALALLGPESAAWHCDAPSFYAVCVRR